MFSQILQTTLFGLMLLISFANAIDYTLDLDNSSQVASIKGKQIVLKVGDTLTISVSERPMTGYRWQVNEPKTSAIDIDQNTYTAKPNLMRDVVGTGGIRKLLIKAAQMGSDSVEIALARPTLFKGFNANTSASSAGYFYIPIKVLSK